MVLFAKVVLSTLALLPFFCFYRKTFRTTLQANIKMLETIKKKLKLTDEKVPYSLRRFGNTSSASIPLTVVTELREQLYGKAVTLVGCGFGVGLSWGTILFHTDENLVISELQEL